MSHKERHLRSDAATDMNFVVILEKLFTRTFSIFFGDSIAYKETFNHVTNPDMF